MTNVYLVRHGQASAGTDDYDRLSDTGIAQARLLGTYWQHSGFRVDAAFHGSLKRQKHTAELALGAIGHCGSVSTLEALNEYDHQVVDQLYGGGTASDGGDLRFDQYVDIMARWRDAPETDQVQSWDSFSKQGWNAIQAAVDAHPDTGSKPANLVFFTSAGIIATVLQQVLSVDFKSTMHSLWHVRNASKTNLLINKDGESLVDYNTVPHLQNQQDKSLITQI